jgi:NADH-ubiquinone oxidoreductase chain 1
MLKLLYLILEVLVVIVPVLLAVAFMTIIERKALASFQRRVGPNTVGYYGVLQPFSDALKLIIKEPVIPSQSNKVLFYLAPVITLFFSLLGLKNKAWPNMKNLYLLKQNLFFNKQETLIQIYIFG